MSNYIQCDSNHFKDMRISCGISCKNFREFVKNLLVLPENLVSNYTNENVFYVNRIFVKLLKFKELFNDKFNTLKPRNQKILELDRVNAFLI